MLSYIVNLQLAYDISVFCMFARSGDLYHICCTRIYSKHITVEATSVPEPVREAGAAQVFFAPA